MVAYIKNCNVKMAPIIAFYIGLEERLLAIFISVEVSLLLTIIVLDFFIDNVTTALSSNK